MNRTAMMLTAGILSVFASNLSRAADLAPPQPYVKLPYQRYNLAPFTWQGFYADFNGGYGWADSRLSGATGTSTVHPAGALLGSGFGYNLQSGNMVYGVEGDADYSWMRDTNAAIAPCASCVARNHDLATVRGRVGYAWDRWLPYITGGAAIGDIQISTPAGGSQATNKVGWTVGGGMEYAFSDSKWSTKLEYLYVNLGSATCDTAHCGASTNAGFRANTIRAGLNYRF